MNQGNELGDALVVEGGRHDTALVSPKLALAREQWFLESRDVPVCDGAAEKCCACRSAERHQNVELFFF
jgi:hypothetical protein